MTRIFFVKSKITEEKVKRHLLKNCIARQLLRLLFCCVGERVLQVCSIIEN